MGETLLYSKLATQSFPIVEDIVRLVDERLAAAPDDKSGGEL